MYVVVNPQRPVARLADAMNVRTRLAGDRCNWTGLKAVCQTTARTARIIGPYGKSSPRFKLSNKATNTHEFDRRVVGTQSV